MISIGRYGAGSRTNIPNALVSPQYAWDRSVTRIDIPLLVAALFLQRFALPYGNTFLQLDLVGIGVILLHAFLSGRVLIHYDRFFWFLGFSLAATCSLLLNFNGGMLTGYFLFVIFFALYSLVKPSTADEYKRTLQAFQFLAMLLSCLAVVQFGALFAGEYDRLMHFYGLVPDSLLGPPRPNGYFLVKFRANGIFLSEPGALSQLAALGILIEVLEFRRPRYLIVLTLGFLLSYGGTGLAILLLFLPLAGLRHDRAAFPALLVVVFALGLVATGIIELSAFTSRTSELETTGTSGYARFVAPLSLAAEKFDFEALQALLVGNGPGAAKTLAGSSMEHYRYTGGFVATWLKVFHEYGLIGSLIFCCYLASCVRRSRCPGIVTAAVIFAWTFLQGSMTITIVLCTLSRLDEHGGIES